MSLRRAALTRRTQLRRTPMPRRKRELQTRKVATWKQETRTETEDLQVLRAAMAACGVWVEVSAHITS